MIIELATIAFHPNHFFFAIGTLKYTKKSLLSVCWKGQGVYDPAWFSVCFLWFRFDWYYRKMRRMK